MYVWLLILYSFHLYICYFGKKCLFCTRIMGIIDKVRYSTSVAVLIENITTQIRTFVLSEETGWLPHLQVNSQMKKQCTEVYQRCVLLYSRWSHLVDRKIPKFSHCFGVLETVQNFKYSDGIHETKANSKSAENLIKSSRRSSRTYLFENTSTYYRT